MMEGFVDGFIVQKNKAKINGEFKLNAEFDEAVIAHLWAGSKSSLFSRFSSEMSWPPNDMVRTVCLHASLEQSYP